jgi:hypothetical protein
MTARPAPTRARPDGRSAIARKLARIRKALAADLETPLSAADDAMLRAAALAIYRVDELEAATICGESVDDENIVRLLNSAHRILGAVAKRGRKSGGPNLKTYLASQADKSAEK